MNLEERIAKTEQVLTDAAKRMGADISEDGRVSERIAAVLVGYEQRSLRNLRYAGAGPARYNRPFAGTEWSYRIVDLAAWIEVSREDALI